MCQILLADMWFMVRTFGPYIAVAAVGIAAFFYGDTIRGTAERAHQTLVQRLGPKPEPLGQSDELVAEMADPSLSTPADQDTAVGTTANVDPVNPASQEMPPESAAHALQAKVGISCFGRGAGVGVVCGVVDESIFVLTNRSLVDPTADAIGRSGLPDETVRVQLQFSTMQRADGELVWVAGSGIDLAIIQCPRVSNSIEPVDWRLQSGPVAEGDRVFYVDALDQVANAGITRVGEDRTGNGSVPIVRVDVPSLAAGTALYNRRGELIAISGSNTPLTIGSVAVSVSALDQLQLSALSDQ